MKRRIWLHYAKNGNMGDMLNIHICEKLFNMKVRDSSTNLCECVFIGSIMDDFLGKKNSFLKYVYPVKIWGTGFIREAENDLFFRRMEIFAVRGRKTLERLKESNKVIIHSDVLGDPGLLSSELISSTQKKYDLGIVPHYIDKDNLPDINLKEMSYKIIDVNSDPLECIQNISQCRTILSSSLHGLIIADSFNIPNKRLIISQRLGDYKYEDYYSAYDIEKYNPISNLRIIDKNVIDLIKEEYVIKEKKVDEIKQKLLLSFPFM